MKYNVKIKEEELKNKVSNDFFNSFDCTKIIGNIDFCISFSENEFYLWAEAKKGNSDIFASITQLIITIGKDRIFDSYLPPLFLGAFDIENIIFISYSDLHDIFYMNDFNWNVTPSNHKTKEFIFVYNKVKSIIEKNSLIFNFDTDKKEIKLFIKNNFVIGKKDVSKIKIDKNNFIIIYNKWINCVKPSISIKWDIAQKNGIIAGDFYLADLISKENTTLKEKLFVLLKHDHYELDKVIDTQGMFNTKSAFFNDGQKAHKQFWTRYERPPKKEYWDYIVERRDLLVPQDIRERKGSFFTPQKWVELSQKYLTDLLGDNWQDVYYIWDCACGTGNLLSGLTNKYNIWASTIDKQDIDILKDRIKNGANLLESHIFQFDFLNDDFNKLPKGLKDIIEDDEKIKKLIIYINPPYAEVSSYKEKGKKGVNKTKIHDKYMNQMGTAARELYIQFLLRIHNELNGSIIAEFSTLKILQGGAFDIFKKYFNPKLLKCFVVPANTFDNVKGQFPIGFKIWDTKIKHVFKSIKSDVYDANGNFLKNKTFGIIEENRILINKWISSYKEDNELKIGFLAGTNGNDFQHNRIVYILNTRDQMANPRGIWITPSNLIVCCIYYAIRHCIEADWLNDRDQYLYPDISWESDNEFKNDCLAYTLFNTNVQTKYGVNHWIPFTEEEIIAKDNFKSHFMNNFINGTVIESATLFNNNSKNKKLIFSKEAKNILNAGLSIYKYYHSFSNINVNASLHDIKEYFKGMDDAGKLKNKSDDSNFNILMNQLKCVLKKMEKKIELKIYEHKFIKN